jgi:uncharacterized repeat protein (TIGR01451 family)
MKTSARSMLVAALMFASPAVAQAQTSVSMEILRCVEAVMASGEITRECAPIQTAVPGEPLVYRVSVANSDTAPSLNVGMQMPLDSNLVIEPDTITSADDFDILFSVDAGATFAAFGDLKVVENGEERQAQASDLTTMKIGISEIPGETTTVVEYTARVE